MKKNVVLIGTGVAVALALLPVVFYWLLVLNHVDINEVGVAYDSRSGNIWVQDQPGWYRTSPLVRVAYLSTLPRKVELASTAQIINAKIVRFRPEGVSDYIRLQGFSYSMDSALTSALLGYAYSGKSFPFLEIIEEAGPLSGGPRALQLANPPAAK